MILAVVLAAGSGSRFQGGHKLLAPFQGHTVVWWAAKQALDAGLEATWVVSGAVDLSAAVPDGVQLLHNPDWASGQASSLQRAVTEGGRIGAEAIVVGLGDQPMVTSSSWRAVADAGGDIAVATYDGRRRNPVKLSARVWDLLPRSGDEGARVLMRSRPDLIEEVPCIGDPADIDTREDLERWS